MVDEYLAELSQTLNAVIIGVDYRLAPETPFPGPLEDCYAGLKWLYSQSAALQVDTNRIVLMGHSAGGGLAAALAILARDRAEYPVVGQVLIYPMLDYRTGTPEAPVHNLTTGEFYWTAQENHFAWNCLRGSYDLEKSRIAYFSPALAEDFSGLPATFIAVGALDLFLEEDVGYGMNLSRAGVPLELHLYPGVFHGFDRWPGQRSNRCNADVLAALRRLVYPTEGRIKPNLHQA
jgi:acetyl esterase/lipase